MAHRLYDITALQPLINDDFVLLTPNSRLARRIKSEWKSHRVAAGDKVWESPRVQPLEQWLHSQWEQAVRLDLLEPLTPLNAGQIGELWRQVIDQYSARGTEFHLLSPIAAADLASSARDALQRWQVDLGQPGIRQLFELDRDCGTLLHWITQFEQRLAEIGACTPTDCLVQLTALTTDLPASRVALVEIDEVAPLVNALFDSLGTEVRVIAAGSDQAACVEHAFSDKRSELRAAAAWAAQQHSLSPEETVGLVLSDMAGDRLSLEYLLRREFNCLGERYTSLPVNFSTGISLSETPLIRDALAVLALSLASTTVPAVVAVLRSRFLELPDAGSALTQKFVMRLYAQGSRTLDIGQLRVAATEVSLGEDKGLALGEHLKALFRHRELKGRCKPSQWIDRFGVILSEWGWPGAESLDSLEFQQLNLWHRTLDEFRGLDAVCPPLDFDAALRLLREACFSQISQPQTVDSPVQVLGPLEAAGLAFEHLWVVGMQGTNWPAAPRPNPFIPVALQTSLQMPHATAEREWAFGTSLLGQYARSCAFLHASYCRQKDGVPEQKSALLSEFVPQVLAESEQVPTSWLQYLDLSGFERRSDEQAPPIAPAQLEELGGGSGLLEDQSQCPFRAFAKRRLVVEPLGDFSIAQSPAERGSLLHDALYALWGEIGDHTSLLALDDAAQAQVVLAAVQSGIDVISSRQRQRLGGAYWELEGQRLCGLLHEWLAVERQRSEFCVEMREQDIALELAQLKIRLRVDRIDLLPDGSRVIIDYKSGSSSVQHWLGKRPERPQRPQLLLYSIAAQGEVAALAFAQVRARECCYVGLGRVAAAPGIGTDIARAVKGKVDANDWESLNEYWQKNLERLAQSFVEGDAAVDPLNTASCTWCGLQPLCRIDHTDLAQDVSINA